MAVVKFMEFMDTMYCKCYFISSSSQLISSARRGESVNVRNTVGIHSTLNMVGKKSGKALLREEGLERTDNGMNLTSWAEPTITNQKNYYTTYMKDSSQILSQRIQNEMNREKLVRTAKDRDRALARTGNTDVPMPDEMEYEDGSTDEQDSSKVVVIHPGSQNLRIGFANDAIPKTIPMCIAYKASKCESEAGEYDAQPMRLTVGGTMEEMFGEEFAKKSTKASNDLKVAMRARKYKVLPNSKEVIIKFNNLVTPDRISEHNDPVSVEWTDTSDDNKQSKSKYFIGHAAQRIPFDAEQNGHKYRLHWPIQHGCLNELEYDNVQELVNDIYHIIAFSLEGDLALPSREWPKYSCVFVVPDLYDRKYIELMLDLCLRQMKFKQVAFVQEGLVATYGAGYPMNCIVDIGAQKTSISCIEDGMIMEDSRINLKYGGYDVTELYTKLMLSDGFPYRDINLVRRHDFLLAEEEKIRVCTLDQGRIAVHTQEFYLRAPNATTQQYKYKTYDEPIIAPMGLFDPSFFNHKYKLYRRRKVIPRSYDSYDREKPNDPESSAQLAILTSIKPSLSTVAAPHELPEPAEFATPQKEKANPMNNLSRIDSQTNGDSQATSAAGSPAPEENGTPIPAGPFIFGANGTNGGSPAPNGGVYQFNGSHHSGTPGPPGDKPSSARTLKDIAEERDAVLPVAPLDTAIVTSIMHAAKGDHKKARDLFGSILLIGGGAKVQALAPYVEEKLKIKRPDLSEKILVGTSPKEIDNQLTVWTGASVFARMSTHESWIGQLEYERLHSRALHHKLLWQY
ncbi:putative actin-related protein [Calycina marina]|uniref:Actin-related protein n=1 Tax=Calycina marina TaxID=1763456 RepID=A0A9P7Z3U4_9HELO|nr:putative actin-related protein [Calycina marina]